MAPASASSSRVGLASAGRLLGAILASGLLLLSTACSVPALQSAALELPEAGETSLTTSALYHAQSFYLYPDRLDRRMIVGALNALENRFDPIRFDEDPPERGLPAQYGTLWVGDERVRVPLRGELVPDEFTELLGRIVRFVEEKLPREPGAAPGPRDEEDDIELVALQGALQELDRYSTVFAGRSTEDFEIRFSGKLFGIGTRVGREEGVLKAIEVFEDGPAARAGLVDGDAIESIDGDPTRALSVRDAVDRIRGEAGTQVLLGISRLDPKLTTEQRMNIPITRGEVLVPSVRTKDLGERIGYARISSVARNTHEEFRDKVKALGPLDGLVLDLRGNTGGSMLASAALADFFVDNDTILRIVDRSGRGASGGAGRTAVASSRVLFTFPVVVLVDGSTASAAEIFSGAIAPLERVTLMGQRTFGKGLIQRVLPLPREHMLKLTVGEYLLSGDRAIHEKGLDPDIELYPVSPENLGALADRPERALPYLREPRADDQRPIEIAKALLLRGEPAALEQVNQESNRDIAAKLEPLGIDWNAEEAVTPDQLGQKLRIEGGPVRILDGTPTRIAVKVSNPNSIAIPHAWVALNGPVDYLRNKLIALGTIPAGGSAWGEVEIEPEDGLASSPLPLTVYVTSGRHQLQNERVEVPVVNHAPELEIEVVRLGEDQLEVSLKNRGCCGAGTLVVSVPGTARPVENLASGETRTVELPLSGDVETVAISLAGAGVSRRIDIPVPVDRVRVIPPTLRLAKTTFLGKSQVRADAISNEGLREGWLALNGEKEIYVAWDGASDGTLRADLDRVDRSLEADSSNRDLSVRTKVETLSGISLIDVRTLVKD